MLQAWQLSKLKDTHEDLVQIYLSNGYSERKKGSKQADSVIPQFSDSNAVSFRLLVNWN